MYNKDSWKGKIQRVTGQAEGGGRMEEIMTDKQFKTILEMFGMILDGCEDLEEAKEKVKRLLEEQKNKSE